MRSAEVIAVLQATPLTVSQGLAGRAFREGKPDPEHCGSGRVRFRTEVVGSGGKETPCSAASKKGNTNRQHPHLA